MQRFLVLTESYKLQALLNQGELLVAPFEFLEIETPLPTPEIYLELLQNKESTNAIHELIFLIIGTKDETPRGDCDGLWLGINEIEFLIALNRTAAGSLRKKHPELHFETLPPNIIRTFLAIRLQKRASAGVGAISILLGLKEPPTIISEHTLIQITPALPQDIQNGIMLHASHRPYYKICPLNLRNFLTLLSAYKRTLDYPAGNAGYILDIIEIYHYVINRYDTLPLVPNNIEHLKEMYGILTHLSPEEAALPLIELIDKLKHNSAFTRFFNALNNFSGTHGLIPFYVLKALDNFGLLKANTPLNKVKISYQHLIAIANELESIEDKNEFAQILGAIVGYEHLAYTLYSREALPILEDFQDAKTDIEKETDDINSPLKKPAPTLHILNSENANTDAQTLATSNDQNFHAENNNLNKRDTLSAIQLEDEDRFAKLLGVKELNKVPSNLYFKSIDNDDSSKIITPTSQQNKVGTIDETSHRTHAQEILNNIRTSNKEVSVNSTLISNSSSNDETVEEHHTPQTYIYANSKLNAKAPMDFETINTAPITALTSNDNNRFGITPFFTDGLINFLDEDETTELDNTDKENTEHQSKNSARIYEFQSLNIASIPTSVIASCPSKTPQEHINVNHQNVITIDAQSNLSHELNKKSSTNHNVNIIPNNQNIAQKTHNQGIQTSTIRVQPYVFANLDSFNAQLQTQLDINLIPIEAIRNAIETLIVTESPISEEFMIERFKLIYKRAKQPFRKNIEERRFRTEIINVCTQLECTQDDEGFILLPPKGAILRKRTPNGISRTIRRAMNRAKTVSSVEIMTAYQYLLKSSIGISRPEPIDIIDLLGLCQRRYVHEEDLNRIQKVLDKHLGNN